MRTGAAASLVIGIPPALDADGGLRPGRTTHYLDAALTAAVLEQGALPRILPGPVDTSPPRGADGEATALESFAHSVLAGVDGLLIPGGDDFVPERGADALPLTPVAPVQLAYDEALAGVARTRGMPILGLCYGMQLLVRLAGGRLIHDLRTERPETADHQLEPDAHHPIRIEPGSRIATGLGTHEVGVNSRHHQAVEEPGHGYVVTARSLDGVIEAIEAESGPFVVGVQWHPEDMDGSHRRAIFGLLLAACGRP